MAESNFIHPLEDIEDHTGLPRKFIERCNAELSGILDAYRMKGDKNKIFYNSNGLQVFDRIKQFKAQGFTLSRIAEALESELGNSEGDQGSNPETSRNNLENREAGEGRSKQVGPATSDLLHALEKSNERVIEAKEEAVRLVMATKEEVIRAKDETIQQLKNNLQLLTDGRSVEEIQAQRRKAQAQEAEFKKLRQRKARRQELLAALEHLDGRWGIGKKRKEILSQLKELEAND